ncbi:MAG: DUF2007 domain-containing protein [Thioalkalispiraceae bacterium]|jgi:hypothetical protein
MELVYTTSSLDEANQVKQQLEEAGIPAMITGENVSRIQLPFLSSNLGVFIYINNQYDDAMSLLREPSHQVNTAIDVEAFYQVMESQEMKKYVARKTNRIILISAIIVASVILTIIILD